MNLRVFYLTRRGISDGYASHVDICASRGLLTLMATKNHTFPTKVENV